MFARLAEVMEQPELASANRYGPQTLRLGARDEGQRYRCKKGRYARS